MRGQDARLEDARRPGADERRLQKDLRRAERLGLDRQALLDELAAARRVGLRDGADAEAERE
jgi:hypothetical protein